MTPNYETIEMELRKIKGASVTAVNLIKRALDGTVGGEDLTSSQKANIKANALAEYQRIKVAVIVIDNEIGS